TYPQECIRRGFPVVREVDYRDALVDVTSAQVDSLAHRVYYSYEDPVTDLRGRGFLGFRKVREWDPSQPRQTITEYDNRRCVTTNCLAPGNYYPGALRPEFVTTAIPIPATGSQTLPVVGGALGVGVTTPNARIIETYYTYQTSQTNGTHVVLPSEQT